MKKKWFKKLYFIFARKITLNVKEPYENSDVVKWFDKY